MRTLRNPNSTDGVCGNVHPDVLWFYVSNVRGCSIICIFIQQLWSNASCLGGSAGNLSAQGGQLNGKQQSQQQLFDATASGKTGYVKVPHDSVDAWCKWKSSDALHRRFSSNNCMSLTCCDSQSCCFAKMNLATTCCCRSVARQGPGNMLLASFASRSPPQQAASEAGTQEGLNEVR